VLEGQRVGEFAPAPGVFSHLHTTESPATTLKSQAVATTQRTIWRLAAEKLWRSVEEESSGAIASIKLLGAKSPPTVSMIHICSQVLERQHVVPKTSWELLVVRLARVVLS
jgi:hypothetical protein